MAKTGIRIICLSLLTILLSVLSAEAAVTESFAQLVEGAKKEGTAAIKLKSGITPQSIARLENEIKERYGVTLKITFAPSASMPGDVQEAIMLNKSGARNRKFHDF